MVLKLCLNKAVKNPKYPFIYLTLSLVQDSGHDLAGSLAQFLTKLQSRCQLGLQSHLLLGSFPFQAHIVLAEFISLHL